VTSVLKRILVIRGGAIGDFILTLPAVRALREAYPAAHIELLGYPRIANLVKNRFYFDAFRSIEYAPLSLFFGKGAVLDEQLQSYFRSFDVIITYLYDPDQIFEQNLRGAGARNIVAGPAKLDGDDHATAQLAVPLRALAISVTDFEPRIFLSQQDREFARDFVRDSDKPFVVIHPGSGSTRKNWPLFSWIELGNTLLAAGQSLVIVSGEADSAQTIQLEQAWRNQSVCFLRDRPLNELAAVLEASLFIGHDSGISHLAAAVDAECLVLFGPTNPAVWAPRNRNVRTLRAPDGNLTQLEVETVARALTSARTCNG
jgi:heptosyltransferase-3